MVNNTDASAGDQSAYKHTWYSAKYCEDIYTDLTLNGQDISGEFPPKQWICPDVPDITVLNSPELYTLGNGT